MFGTSIPIAILSGIGAILTFDAPNDNAISSDNDVILENLTPLEIVISNLVIDGPRTIFIICAVTPKLSSVSISLSELSLSSSVGSTSEPLSFGVSNLIDGYEYLYLSSSLLKLDTV